MSFKDFLIVLGVTFGWGLSFTLGKLAIHDVPPFFMMACRFVLVVAVGVPFIRFPREHLKPLAVLAFIVGFFHYGLTYIALRDLSTGMTALLTQMQLPMTLLIAWMVYGEKPNRFQIGGLVLAFAGLYVLVGQPEINANIIPMLLILLAALAVAISSFVKKKYAAIPAYTATIYIALLSLPLHIMTSAMVEGSPFILLQHVSWNAGIAIVYMAFLSSLLCLSGWLYLLSKYNVSMVSSYGLLIPVFSYGTAAILLGEGITAPIVAASAVILCGLYFMQKTTSVISAPEEA